MKEYEETYAKLQHTYTCLYNPLDHQQVNTEGMKLWNDIELYWIEINQWSDI